MSTMLEDAIVDATALREAVLARYSGQIKDTVESLLEQDEQQGQTYGGTPAAPKDADDKSIVEAQLDEYEGKAYAFGDLSDSNNFELEQEEEIEIVNSVDIAAKRMETYKSELLSELEQEFDDEDWNT